MFVVHKPRQHTEEEEEEEETGSGRRDEELTVKMKEEIKPEQEADVHQWKENPDVGRAPHHWLMNLRTS